MENNEQLIEQQKIIDRQRVKIFEAFEKGYERSYEKPKPRTQKQRDIDFKTMLNNIAMLQVFSGLPVGDEYRSFVYVKRKDYRKKYTIQRYFAVDDLFADIDYIFKKHRINITNIYDIIQKGNQLEVICFIFINMFKIDEILQNRFNPEQKPISTIQIIKDNFEPLEAEYLTKLILIPAIFKSQDNDYKEQMCLDNPVYMYNWGNEGED